MYLNPPDKAVVLCVDEKPQAQALERAAPVLPLRPGVPEKRSHDYIRHGTTTLFAALEVATGKVTDACYPRHRHEEFLKFLRQVAGAYPRRELHIVADNYGTHKHPDVRAWLAVDAAFGVLLLARDPRQRHACDAKPHPHQGISQMGFR